MRRSAAPSLRKQSDLSARTCLETSSIPSSSDERKQAIIRRQVLHPIPSDIKSEVHNNGQRYEVVYAKRSTKKHKKWEEDGILTVSGLHVKICSTEGKEIASTTLKAAELSTMELGTILSVGGYECQLISLLNESETSKESGTSHLARGSPKPIRNTFNMRRHNSVQLQKPDEGSFKLPSPPSSHIWKHNSEGLQVLEVFLSGSIAARLHPYQLEGIKFLYECVLGYRRVENQHIVHSEVVSESVGDETCDIYGGILADEMGLGKTVQVIGLLSVLLKQGPYGGQPVIRRCLIVTPGSLVANWQKEFRKWVSQCNISTYCVSQDNPLKAYFSQMKPPPVIILSYEMLLQHADRIAEMASLDLVICDEGHRLKNLEIKTTTVLKRLPARRRIILTGTPIQNDLNEFWSLAEFVAPGCLASDREEYRTCIVNPLSKSLHSAELFKVIASADARVPAELVTDSAESLGALQRLKTALRMFMLRRTSDMIVRRLPDKVEQIVFCEASSLQRELESVLMSWIRNQLDYNMEAEANFINMAEDSSEPSSFENGIDVLACIMAFRKLYNHPSLLLESLSKYSKRKFESTPAKSFPDGLADHLFGVLQRDLPPTERGGCSSAFCLTSGKLAVLQHLLTSISQMHTDPPSLGGSHRLVLVSNFTQTLDLLEPICRAITKSPCLRIDGKTPTKRRIEIVDRFNSPTCVERVLLLSSKAGGTGLNLIGADFLVLFDIDWNPATDAQALARVWREGQKRRVHLIRLITADGLEERILQRQIAKSLLATTAMSSLASATTNSLSLSELKELFQSPPGDSICWTHDLLDCRCQGISNDDVSNSKQKSPLLDEDDTRTFQLSGPGQRMKEMTSTTKGLGQVKTWNHFLSPEAVTEAAPLMAASKCVRAVFQHVATA
ncbi:DNA repair and recombination protein RAD54B [Taenia crassiceps]|uniref:DNA repair and recombination protein RAD54B n=1 Tax=Taenia crassiceps TaxID=6207 RepID=A0ABR4Q1E1_9CEST